MSGERERSHGRGWRLGVTLAELGTRLIAKRLENHDRQMWVRLPLSSATPQYSSISDCSMQQQNQRARFCRQFYDVALAHARRTVVFDRRFGGRIFRHCTVLLCIPLFEATAKTTISAIKAVAASSAIIPLVTAQTVASGRGFGGRILGRTHSRQAQAARRRTQNSPRQILRFMSA